MGKLALYRKYRPMKLGEIIGQEHITSVLEAAIKGGRVSHAYLLTGQRGTGKTSVARILAHEVNQIPYGQESFDIIEIDAASHGLKEDIKELIEKSIIAPIQDKYKVYIIDEIHSMKHDAFNTFLKLLEEPPQHVIFILATTDPQKLPATILSRAQRYHFRPVGLDKVAAHLKNIAGEEKIDITDDALNLIAARGEGSFRDSISLLDQLSGLGGTIDGDTVEQILGLAPQEKISGLVAAILGKDSTAVIKIIDELKQSGVAGRTVVDQLIKQLLTEAASRPALFDLIDKLVDSVGAFDIYLKLLAVLGSQTAVSKPVIASDSEVADPSLLRSSGERTIQSKIPRAKSTSPQELAVAPVKPIVSEAVSRAVEKPKPAPEKPSSPPPQEINWEEFVKTVQKSNSMCGGSLSGASYDYDGETLTLYFRSKTFRERMRDSKWKSLLKNALIELYETPPKIDISDSQKPKNAALSAVADIMGGGEVL
jgi:DNA polymerase-3 subunit gamma/tau